MIRPDAVLAICRFGHDAALMLLWGTFGYLAWLVPAGLSEAVARRLAALRVLATMVAVASVVAALPVEAALVGDGWGDALAPSLLSAVALETSVGRAWLVGTVATLAVAGSLAVPPERRSVTTATTSGLALATLALSGHAAMHESGLGLVHQANDVLHVLAGGAWFGALLPLLQVLRRLQEPEHHGSAIVALTRFSRVGHAAVTIVLATGLINTLLVLGRWPVDAASDYQALLASKIALAAAMTALALVNRYAVVPALPGSRGPAMRVLRCGTLAEIGLGLLVLGCVGVLGLLEPA